MTSRRSRPQAHANFCKNIQCAQCESCKCGDWCEPYFNQFPTQAEHYCGNAECWGCSFCEEFAFASASNNSAVILVTPRPPPTPPYPPSMPDWDSIEWGSGSGAVTPSPAALTEAAPSPEPGLVGDTTSPLDDAGDLPAGDWNMQPSPSPKPDGTEFDPPALTDALSPGAGDTPLEEQHLSEAAAPSPDPDLVGDTTSPLDDAGDLPAGDWNMQPSPSPKPDGTEFDPPAELEFAATV